MPKPVYRKDSLEGVMEEILGSHGSHPWHKVGRCVYCGPCHARLYTGDIPKDHEIYVPPKKPSSADKMRAKWNKDA